MKMLTVTEAAKSLNVTPALIRIYIRQGLFPGAVKVRGTRWQIPAAAVELFDGTDVSGAFAKRKKSPFCRVEEEKFTNEHEKLEYTQWAIMSGGIPLVHASSNEAAIVLAKIYNEAAEKWLEEN